LDDRNEQACTRDSRAQMSPLPSRLREVIFKNSKIHNLTFKDAQINFNNTQFV